ncbi:hypothetical protein LHS21_004565 [Salmonella enterica subsp. enterica serovar Newport]|nr:hypothetical protein [Salmonella enterica subsp. enterica serovar Newport]
MDVQNRRHQFFKYRMLHDSVIPAEARKIKKSRAWLNVQEMLKRSGRRCISGKPSKEEKEVPATDIFNFEDVCHLYKLYRTVECIKAGLPSGAAIELEICELKRGRSHWAYNFVIAPKHLRRKADAYRQMKGTDRHAPRGFKGSLYRALLDLFGDRKKLDIALVEHLSYDQPLFPLQQVIAGSPSLLIFRLLCTECRRLNFRSEENFLLQCTNYLCTEQLIEKFGEACFFTFLYHTREEDLFFSFFMESLESEKYMPVQSEDDITRYPQIRAERRKRKILDFIEMVHNRFLCTAYRRKRIQEEIASDVKK